MNTELEKTKALLKMEQTNFLSLQNVLDESKKLRLESETELQKVEQHNDQLEIDLKNLGLQLTQTESRLDHSE